MKSITRKIIVAAINSNGESDFHFFKVTGLEEHFEDGIFHAAAKKYSENEGYDPCLVYDETDSAGRAIMNKFVWKSASTVYLDKNGILVTEQFFADPKNKI